MEWLVQQDAYNKMDLEHKRQHYHYSCAWLASCQPPAAFYLPSQEAGKIPPGLINMRETCEKWRRYEGGRWWLREVMAEGRNQACQHWHEKLSAWRGGRVMRVCKGEWEGNPRQLLFLWVFQSSHKNAALIWEKFKSGKGSHLPSSAVRQQIGEAVQGRNWTCRHAPK